MVIAVILAVTTSAQTAPIHLAIADLRAAKTISVRVTLEDPIIADRKFTFERRGAVESIRAADNIPGWSDFIDGRVRGQDRKGDQWKDAMEGRVGLFIAAGIPFSPLDMLLQSSGPFNLPLGWRKEGNEYIATPQKPDAPFQQFVARLDPATGRIEEMRFHFTIPALAGVSDKPVTAILREQYTWDRLVTKE